MEEYRSNSNKSKERGNEPIPEKKVEKIVNGPVKSKKKNGIQRITNVFVPEDVDNVKSYILEDIIVPAVKDILLDTLKAFLGVNGHSGSKNNAAGKVSYRKYYEESNRRDYGAARTRTAYEYDDVILDSRGEAEEVLARMDELIATYGIVSVADFYDLVGLTGNYTDNKYGWDNIRSAGVVRTRDGYMIKLPRAMAIN
jgi:hypothetical protein